MRVFLSAIMLAASAATAGAQAVSMKLDPASSVRIEGSSNVHDWHAVSTQLTANITVAAPVAAGAKVESVTLTLPVTSLKSGKGGLDKNMYKAMNAERNPTITFVMKTYDAVAKDSGFAATISGMLTVNGVEKPITALATMTADARGVMKAVGTTTFRMTDFGIKPVTALLGTIRTADLVTIRFELTGAAATAVANLDRD
jgi:polyisoprenoid-binding protein YceI